MAERGMEASREGSGWGERPVSTTTLVWTICSWLQAGHSGQWITLLSLVVACVALLCDFCWKRYDGCEGDFQLCLPQKLVLHELRQVKEIPTDRVILKLPLGRAVLLKFSMLFSSVSGAGISWQHSFAKTHTQVMNFAVSNLYFNIAHFYRT